MHVNVAGFTYRHDSKVTAVPQPSGLALLPTSGGTRTRRLVSPYPPEEISACIYGGKCAAPQQNYAAAIDQTRKHAVAEPVVCVFAEDLRSVQSVWHILWLYCVKWLPYCSVQVC